LAEPFLLLGEIENLIRGMIGDRFSASDFASARDPNDSGRKIAGPADLAIGESIRLLENPDRWQQFVPELDRMTFCKTSTVSGASETMLCISIQMALHQLS
jgi:hypothetical protein